MKARVNFDGNWLSDTEVRIYQYDTGERIKRGLKTFSVFLGAALLALLIPVLHFFLVPIFLILSLSLSIQKFKEVVSVDLKGIICPECKITLKDSAVGVKKRDMAVRLNCESCRKTLTIFIEESSK